MKKSAIKNVWLGFSGTIIGLFIFIKYTILMIWDKRKGRDPMVRLDKFRDSIFKNCYRRMNLQLQIDDRLTEIPDRPILTYGKHMDTMAIFCYYHTLRTTFPHRPIIVIAGKPRMKNLFGLVARAVEAIDGIIIDRENPEKAVEIIRQRAKTHHEQPVFVIFPEGHRATKKRLEETHVFLKKIGRGYLIDAYKHTQAPRSKGTHALLNALSNPMCVRISCGFNVRNAFGTLSSYKLINAIFLMQLDETTLPRDAKQLKQQLMEVEFPEINDIIEHHIGRREHAEYLKPKTA